MKKRLAVLTLFSITFAFFVTAVMYFIRSHYYPNGFDFPVKLLKGLPFAIEYMRQLANLVIIFCVAYLAGRNVRERMAAFMFVFGLWDIFYYIWFYILIQWPPDLMAWDLLYRVPVHWSGPVIAPIIVSIALIKAALLIFYSGSKNWNIKFNLSDWLVEIFAGIGVLTAFLWNYQKIQQGKIPEYFPWWIFGVSVGLGICYFAYRFGTFYISENRNG